MGVPYKGQGTIRSRWEIPARISAFGSSRTKVGQEADRR